MLRELSGFAQIDIFGVDNPAELANRVYKENSTSPTVLIFKYKYSVLESLQKVGISKVKI